jgi:hypothetical protein
MGNDPVRALIWKEFREQINLFALSLGAVTLIFVFHSIMRYVKPEHYWAGHDAIVTFIFIMWLVLSTGTIAGAFSSDRDRGACNFIAALPVRPLWIWIVKVSVAAYVTAAVVIFTLLTGWLFGYSNELSLLLPHLIIPLRLMGVMVVCTLFVAVFFRRAMTIWLTGMLLGTVLIMGYFLMVLYLAWEPSFPQWSIYIVLGCMVAGSAWADGVILSGGLRSGFQKGILILFVSGLVVLSLTTEYFATFYRYPDPVTARTLKIVDDGNCLLIQSDLIAPIHVLDIETGVIRRVSRRFALCSWGEDIHLSQSGRYMLVQQYRYLFGLFPLSRSMCNDLQSDPAVRAIQRHLHLGSRPAVNFQVIDLRTGHRFDLDEFERSEAIFPLGWHPGDDLLICLSICKTPRGNERNLCTFSPCGDLIRQWKSCQDCRYTLSYGRESIVKIDHVEMETINPCKFTYEHMVIGETEWNPVDSLEEVPRLSPDGLWEIRIEIDDSGTSHFVCKSRHDSDNPSFDLGSLSTLHPVFRWMPDSSSVLCRRDDESRQPVLEMFDPLTQSVTPLASTVSEAFSQVVRSSQIYFAVSENGKWIVIREQANRSASLFAFSVDNPQTFKVWKGAEAIGWEYGKRFLYRTGKMIRAWNPRTDADSDWFPGRGRRQA